MAALPREALDAGTIMATHMEGLRRQLRARLASEHDAEDLAQETCLRFLVEWRQRDDIRNPRAYLQQIARNLLYVHYTAKANQLTDTGAELDALIDEDQDLEGWINDVTRVAKIDAAWRELSPKCRQALHLRWREGMRVKEISIEMRLSQGMVKKYLAQGLAHCRKRLSRAIAADRVAA